MAHCSDQLTLGKLAIRWCRTRPFSYQNFARRRSFFCYYWGHEQELRLRKLTTLLWLLFPMLAFGAPHSSAHARTDASIHVQPAPSNGCDRQFPANTGIQRPARTVGGVTVSQEDSPHHSRHRQRQLLVLAECQSPLLVQQSAKTRANDRSPWPRVFFFPGRSPPSC